MAVQVTTLGIDLPDDFPHQPYNAVHAKTHSAPRNGEQTFHYGGAWNGIVYRFLSCADADVRFTKLVGMVPGHLNRFHQEEALFSVFINGLSVIESFFYGLYQIGSIAEPLRFPILTGDGLRSIKTDKTSALFRAGAHSGLFTNSFAALQIQDAGTGNWQNTTQYAELKDVRNILAHRASYGRVIHASVGGGQQIEDVWRVRDIPINNQVTQTRRTWLAATLRMLLESAEAYAVATL